MVLTDSVGLSALARTRLERFLMLILFVFAKDGDSEREIAVERDPKENRSAANRTVFEIILLSRGIVDQRLKGFSAIGTGFLQRFEHIRKISAGIRFKG